MSQSEANPGSHGPAVRTTAAAVPLHRPAGGEIESRWQDWWAAHGTFDSPNPAGSLAAGFAQQAGRPKFYVLDFFPYPSGTGLHVGHPLATSLPTCTPDTCG